jgi:IclR family pca regulon transcriptional regulator
LADLVGLSRSTTHRYVVTLTELGYLEQRGDRKYRLGLKVTDLGLSAIGGSGLRASSLVELQRLRKKTGLATGLAVLDGVEVVYLERLPGVGPVEADDSRRSAAAGSRLPADRTAVGKVLLAGLPEAQQVGAVDQLSSGRRGRMTDNARQALLAELSGIARDGFVVSDEEDQSGLRGIALPVEDRSGELIAALELTASESGVPVAELMGHKLALQQTAQRISAALPQSRR